MATVHYVECPLCRREYYVDQILYEAIMTNPAQGLVCPFCKQPFRREVKP